MAKTKKGFKLPTLEELLEAGCHFGHQARRWNPKMQPYIYQARGGVHIFDLVKTQAGLKRACEVVEELGKTGKTLMMVGTKRQAQAIVKEEAIKAGAFYMTERWLGGVMTNWSELKKRVDKLIQMREKREKGEYSQYTKREQVLIDKEIVKLARFLDGLVGLTDLPDAVFIVDTHKEVAAVREAKARGVKVIGMVDTNADPNWVDEVIPANDDAVRSIKLVVEQIGQAYAAGKKQYKPPQAEARDIPQAEKFVSRLRSK